MGYADIKARKRHEADAARIAELEAQLKREREARQDAPPVVQPPPMPPPQPPPPAANQTVVVRNEGCLAGAGRGCLSVIGAIVILAIIGKIIAAYGG